MANRKQTQKAFAFSITLWIIASLLFATVVILRFAKDEVNLSRGLNSKLQTQMIAQSVFDALKFYIPTADHTFISLKNPLLEDIKYPFPPEIVVDGREYNLSKEVSISLKDTSALLNVMYASSRNIANGLLSNNNESLIATLTDSLDDWRDEDDIRRANGAEQNSYLSLGKKKVVRNLKSIQDIHELKLIKGFEQISLNQIESTLYYGRSSFLNLMLIENTHYLATLLEVDKRTISNLLALRKENSKKYIKNIMRLEHYDDNYMGFRLSKQFMVQITVKISEAKSVLNATISFKKFKNRPYMTISYTIH
jgi:general secretion pathway protein K